MTTGIMDASVHSELISVAMRSSEYFQKFKKEQV